MSGNFRDLKQDFKYLGVIITNKNSEKTDTVLSLLSVLSALMFAGGINRFLAALISV